ncbi:MAG TPA: STAS domain-containing protein [Actinomycetota bacterium]|nr:STAS domain-containing protein [Actinomycetota bacterium]
MSNRDLRPSGDLLTLDVDDDGDSVVIRASGELEISTTATLDRELQKALDGKASTVTLDLSDLSFVDSTGLRLLINAASHARANGTRLRMRDGSQAVKRALEVTGLDRSLPFID